MNLRRLTPLLVQWKSSRSRRAFSIGLAILGISISDEGHAAKERSSRAISVTSDNAASTVNNASRLEGSYGNLPLAFESNEGQTDAAVKFVARGPRYTLFLTSDKTVLMLRGKERVRGVLSMTFRGANTLARVAGLEELDGRTNYFVGNDPKKWRSGVIQYAKVKYSALYAGIDVVYYGQQHQLEYDLIVAPHADPKVIALDFDGTEDVRLEEGGDLLLRVAGLEFRQRSPVIYQIVDGIRRSVPGRYVMTGPHTVGIALTDYDVSRPLVIDPLLAYATYVGGSDVDKAFSITVDAFGHAYVTGRTSSTLDFPTTTGALQPAPTGGMDGFVMKLNRTGSALVYCTYLGGTGDEYGAAIAVDLAGNAYVAGGTNSLDFPTTAGSFQPALAGSIDVFVSKLNPTGSALVYSTYLGGTFDDGLVADPTIEVGAFGIAVDLAGQAYVTAVTNSQDFPTTLGAFQRTPSGGFDAFVTKLNRAGSALVYSTYFGGSTGHEFPTGIAVDLAGQAYVTGSTNSVDFPTTRQAFQGVTDVDPVTGSSDGFVTKLNRTGSDLVYSSYLGGHNGDVGTGIAVDTKGQAYVTGWTFSFDFPITQNALRRAKDPHFLDAFVTKVNSSGSALVYSTYLGGNSEDVATGIAVDVEGKAYVTGRTFSADFPTTHAFQPTIAGFADAFVSNLDPSGSRLVYSTYLGGSGNDGFVGVTAIAVDLLGQAYVAGTTDSPDFPVTARALQRVLAGGLDAFVAKIEAPR